MFPKYVKETPEKEDTFGESIYLDAIEPPLAESSALDSALASALAYALAPGFSPAGTPTVAPKLATELAPEMTNGSATAMAGEEAEEPEPAQEDNQLQLFKGQKKRGRKYEWNTLFQPERLHPRVESLIYWRDPIVSGIVFALGLITLLALAHISFICMVPLLLLIIMLGSLGYRLYVAVMQALSEDPRIEVPPFSELQHLDLTLSEERVQRIAGVAVKSINNLMTYLKNLFLFDDVFESTHFGISLFSLTVFGSLINGMTMLILAFVFVFTVPKLYEDHKLSIDNKFNIMSTIADKIRVENDNDNGDGNNNNNHGINNNNNNNTNNNINNYNINNN